MSFLTYRERQRRRIIITLSVVGVAAVIAFGAILLLATTTDAFVQQPPTLPPEISPTPGPTATLDVTLPLPLEALNFTPTVTQGTDFVVEVFTEPETRCNITVTLFLHNFGGYRSETIADYVTDASGICGAFYPITENVAAGEQTVRINLRRGERTAQAYWAFDVVAAAQAPAQ